MEIRRIPAPLKRILDFDEALTNKLFRWSQDVTQLLTALKSHSELLEISCHDIPWFAGVTLSIVMSSSATLIQILVNLMFGLVIDVILVNVIKAYVRRRRPSKNDEDKFAALNIDNFSFPSGHAARAVMVTYFCTMLCPLPFLFVFPVFIWAIAVCLSRILLNHQHIIDVFAGMVLGYIDGIILGVLWLGKDLSCYLVSWLNDTEYDVE